MSTPTAYPLSWPMGWQRTPLSKRSKAPFTKDGAAITTAPAVQRLSDELRRLGARDVVISTNLLTRNDGLPRASQPAPADPGAAAYFTFAKRPTVLACDRWNTVAGNLAAIAGHIDALRRQDRYGVGTLEQAFTGYAALPPPSAPEDWRAVLGNPSTLADAEAAWKRLMRDAHPDVGGSDTRAASLNAAIAAARRELRP